MDQLNELAKLFKERNNPTIPGIQIGKVISIDPFKVSLGDKIILDSDELVICETAFYKYELTEGVLNQVSKLSSGDDVILIPSSDEQTYYLIDKVVS